jgi:glycosyltransferase involved in cell wall biosynthesis
MKITHVIPALTRGGAERVVVDLANAAAGRGHDVTILVGHSGDPSLFSIDPRVTLQAIRSRGPVRAVYLHLLPYVWRNRGWLFEQDIIHCHLTLGAVFGSILGRLRRLLGRTSPKILETSHAVGMPIPEGRRRLFARLAADRDGYVLMAEDNFWRSFSETRPDLPIQIIPNGTRMDQPVPDAKARADYRARHGIPAAGLLVGSIGRLSPDRNPAALLAAFVEIAKANGEVHFLMGGEGPLLEDLRATAAAEDIADRVHFPGLVVDVPLALSVIDLYVSVNVGPVTGLAGLEAAAAGVPVISLQARKDYEGGTNDWIWSAREPDAVAVEALRLLDSPDDRSTVAERQREHVRRHLSTDTAASAYQEFYEALLS